MSDPYEDMADDVKKIHDNIEAMKDEVGSGQENNEEESESEKETEKQGERTQDTQQEKRQEELEEKLEKTRKSAEDLWNTVEGTDSKYPGFRSRGEDETEREKTEGQASGNKTEGYGETTETPESSDEQEFREAAEQALAEAEDGNYREARREYQWLSQRFRSLKAKGKLGNKAAKMLEKLRDRVDLAKEEA